MKDQSFICTGAISGSLYPGRHVVCRNVGPDSPVPVDLAWALRPMPREIAVVDPFYVDCAAQAREAAAAAAYLAEASKPRHSYSSSEVAARLRLSLDDFTECLHHLGCPQPRMGFISDGLNGPVQGVHIFDGPDVDRYVERVERLFGKRKATR
jgi:hypothetical protein